MARTWTFPVLSADSHLEYDYSKEWLEFIPEKYRDRAPHTFRRDDGRDVWIIEGAMNFGGLANVRPDYSKAGPKALAYQGTPSAGPPSQRVQEQVIDGVSAEVLYSSTGTPRFFRNVSEDGAYKALVRGYNAWLGQAYCAEHPDRLIGVGIMPWTGVEDAIAELEFCKNHGVRVAAMSRFPSGKTHPTLEDDRFYQAAADMQMPITVHVGMDAGSGSEAKLFQYPPTPKHPNFRGRGIVEECTNNKFCLAGGRHAIQMIFAGVFDRLPDFRLFLVENQIGWVPHFFEQADARYVRHLPWSEQLMDFGRLQNGRPSDYMREHIIWGFQENKFGVRNREILGGATHLIWASDFGHQESAWPDSLELLEEDFEGVADDEVYQMVCGNAVDFYHLEDLLPIWEARVEK